MATGGLFVVEGGRLACSCDLELAALEPAALALALAPELAGPVVAALDLAALEPSSPSSLERVSPALARLSLALGRAGVRLAAALAALAATGWGRVTAIATAPSTPAAPTPRVTADMRASPCLRASCRAEPEVGELLMSCSVRGLACEMPRCWWSMRLRCIPRLCYLWVLPLNRLCDLDLVDLVLVRIVGIVRIVRLADEPVVLTVGSWV